MAISMSSRRRAAIPENSSFDTVQVGHIVRIDEGGRPYVHFQNAPRGEIVARVGTADPEPTLEEMESAPKVLLTFEGGDPLQPIIVGFVRGRFARSASKEVALVRDPTRAIEVNGRALVFEGREEIVLRCGLGSLTIRANGHIVVKGTRLVSRASETNKIRGASVQIN